MSGYGTGGSGEAEQYLGSLEVTTDSHGQAIFDVPLHPTGWPARCHRHRDRPRGQHAPRSRPFDGLPSQAPAQSVQLVPGQPLIFSAAAGDAIALAGPRCRAARPGVGADAFGLGRDADSLEHQPA